jgi:hypothetical protein
LDKVPKSITHPGTTKGVCSLGQQDGGMTERKRLFRRVFESMMEGRSRAAQRYITEYLKARQAVESDTKG